MSTPIKTWRLRAELTPAAASEKAGVTLAMWSRWETGYRPLPAARVLDIERITGISRHELRPDIFGPAEDQRKAS